LEHQVISGTAIPDSELDQYELGQFRTNFRSASNSLQTLLLSVRSLDEKQKERLLMTVLSLVCIYRSFKVKAKASIETITNPYDGTTALESIIEAYFQPHQIDKFLDKFMDKSKLGNFDELFVYSGNASSPNGGHSSINYLADAAAVKGDNRLKEAIFDIIANFKNGHEFRQIMEILMVNVDDDYQKDKIHSRLVTFTAPGGKSRVIAIADWLSQTALSAIHKTQFRLLELIPSDRTFDHKAGLDLYDELAHTYHSVDLSAATDRFP
jgi:hypothetical protein